MAEKKNVCEGDIVQLEVKNSPFTEEQTKVLNEVLPKLSASQQVWLSGYLTALANATLQFPEQQVTTTQSVPNEKLAVTILYGSQTGNGEGLAKEFAQKLESIYDVTLVSMEDFKPNTLKKLSYLLLIVSTHGEGDPPDNAILFYEFLNGKRAPKLNDLQYSVLSLGDSSYELFCQTGKDFDERLQQLGATQLCPRVDCDLDYDEPASEWFQMVTEALSEKQAVQNPTVSVVTETTEQTETYSRTNPFYAEVLENINLNGRGSNKETRHLELSLEGSHLQFEPGDSLGIYPENDPSLVDTLIAEMKWNPDELVTINRQGEEKSLLEALRHHFEITVLTKPLLEKAIPLVNKSAELKELLENEKAVREYVHGRDLLDFIRDYSLNEIPAKEFVSILRKMPARLYSVASSLKANSDEVHLTIGKVAYHAHGRYRFGVCSAQCADRIEVGDTLPVYVHKNSNFRLPSDSDTPIIMIGPGTGIAPFRAFLQEREEIGAQGKSWLFFGDQHYVTDFLYQVEWQQWLKQGVLSRIDLAFSRDTERKIYVQHRMLEKSKELYAWLQDGAVVYVCGDEKHMAKDVHQTLLTILMNEGNMDEDAAKEYIAQMQKDKRYQRDVY